jgi:hypothetical protein
VTWLRAHTATPASGASQFCPLVPGQGISTFHGLTVAARERPVIILSG